jgi:hypothetical protein
MTDLPPYEKLKRSERDLALVKRHPDRAKTVKGWAFWPHTTGEIAGIRRFLETGDPSTLPAEYWPQLEPNGYPPMVFDTHGADSTLNHRSGELVNVTRLLTPEEADLHEVGVMLEVRFADGSTAHAYMDELSFRTE